MRPDKVEGFLRALDHELALAGCTRGEMPDAKSAVTLIGHPEALAGLDGRWLTPYICRTCEVREPNAAVEVLGAVVGDIEAVFQQFDQCVKKTGAVHQAIEELDDPAMELTLSRSCADASRAHHLLRTAGDTIAEGPVGEHDLQQQALLERILGRAGQGGPRSGGVGAAGWWPRLAHRGRLRDRRVRGQPGGGGTARRPHLRRHGRRGGAR